MGFILTLIYLTMTLMTPKELVPGLLELRIVLVVFLAALMSSSLTAIGGRFSIQSPAVAAAYRAGHLCGDVPFCSLLRWFAGALDAVMDLLFLAGIVLVVSWEHDVDETAANPDLRHHIYRHHYHDSGLACGQYRVSGGGVCSAGRVRSGQIDRRANLGVPHSRLGFF